MNIKVCGITTLKQLQQLDGLDVDFAGLIFYKQSPRYAGNKLTKEEISGADLDIKKVGVFVNEEYDAIMQTVEDYELDIVQLHGDESPHLCEKISAEIEVIKAFRVDDKSDKSIDYMIAEYDEFCDYYLFDAAHKELFGGSGEKFDWKKIAESKIEKPFFLSGGISPKDAALVKKFRHPDFYGVDINSQFEKEPGVKDMALVLQFIHGLK
ncbi:phosphoribosylanthranilate isomerase [Ferruginibacter sp. HRS2-29]|uniref:phosphoribosylanthranilate isomerase n=1 Tax=Ferruginibacter sp. HRS2-29 TaxID=2487334 RepID=UPI0020CD2116|nr:phosphoribosylanthranilate isomerase [Ferruginibacter sp. HRS2-29]MCP9752477.1 phosphoribosylanthranilate isomerase [Ferruginibacter sp. HRS2-29]